VQSLNRRLRISIEIGIVSGVLCWLGHRGGAGDFAWAFHAANDLLAGRDPYDRAFGREAIPYPLPAAILAVPFTLIPLQVAGALFFGLSSAILAYALSKDDNKPLLVFLSYPFFAAIQATQWTPLLMAAALYPYLSAVLLAKPNIGLPIGLTHLSKTSVTLCLGMLALSFAIHPRWLLRWLSQLGEYQSFVPILTFPGPLLALALWYYKDHSARVLLLLSMMPQRWFYDSLPLWLIPKTSVQFLFTATLSWAAYLGWVWFPHTLENTAFSSVTFIYLPMLVAGVLKMPLWRRGFPFEFQWGRRRGNESS